MKCWWISKADSAGYDGIVFESIVALPEQQIRLKNRHSEESTKDYVYAVSTTCVRTLSIHNHYPYFQPTGFYIDVCQF